MATYETSDVYITNEGLSIRLVLLYPRSEERLPAVIACRGNINNVDEPFMARCGELASRGYVVVVPSYRGEVGSEGETDLGAGDARDVLATVDYVQSLPYVDRGRIGMWGNSRGGMAAMLAAENTHLLHALVLTAPLVSMFDLYSIFKARGDPSLALITGRIGGGPEEEYQEFRRRSPLFAVDRLTCPVLVMHGEDDPVVPAETALRLKEALATHSTVPFQFILYPGSGHRFALEDTSQGREARQRIADFFDCHLGKGVRST